MSEPWVHPAHQPGVQLIPMACKVCANQWEQGLLGNVPVEVWVLHVQSLRCPNCGAGHDRLALRYGEETSGQREGSDG
jgi:hypothetical protein